MSAKNIKVAEIIQGCSVFAALSEAERRELTTKARVEHFPERAMLSHRGEKPEYLRYVLSGSAELALSTSDGNFASLPLFHGMWATWIGCMSGKPPVHDLWCSANAHFIALPCRDIHRIVSANPIALLAVIELIGEWARLLTGWVLSYSAYGPEKRLIYMLLLASSGEVGPPEAGLRAALTQANISQFGFGSRQKVSRLLHGLDKKGLIRVGYGAVTIPSRARLQAFLDDEPEAGDRDESPS